MTTWKNYLQNGNINEQRPDYSGKINKSIALKKKAKMKGDPFVKVIHKKKLEHGYPLYLNYNPNKNEYYWSVTPFDIQKSQAMKGLKMLKVKERDVDIKEVDPFEY